MKHFLPFDTSLLPEDRVSVVICGSGIAGLTCAIVLKELGLDTLLLTRGIGNTYYSQGGIAAAVHPSDSSQAHFLDTLRAGRRLNNEEALKILVGEGVLRIADLERWGVEFDKDERGEYATTTEGGHSFPRVLKVRDFTGREIYQKLLKRVKDLGITVVEGELQEIFGEDGVQGIIWSDGKSLKVIRTPAVVLATGGAASLFRYTSNPERIRGDGIGIGLRAGAYMVNPEFVQFHPTVLEGSNLLISEAVRGEGGILVDQKGERFIDELKPRDEISRAIYSILKEGGRVFLDMRPILKRGIDLEERFPTIVSFLRERGYDPYREPIPVVPAAHYYIGGLGVDTYGRTAVAGLYAVGECACTGVHGANRLASNSLLEGVVFGYRTAYRIFLDIKYLKVSSAKFSSKGEGTKEPSFTFEDLRNLMWSKVGLEREKEGLEEAERKLTEWLESFSKVKRTPYLRQLYDLTLVALLTVRGALWRRESRGVHYRKDHPYENDSFRRDTVLTL